MSKPLVTISTDGRSLLVPAGGTAGGAGTLTLTGGNLLADETAAVAVTGAKPKVPTGALKGWSSVKASVGKFTPRVLLPGGTRPVTGSGVYLPKSNSAWGYFPGTSIGGRVELTIP